MIIDFHLKKFPDMVVDLIEKYSNCKNIYVSSDQEYLKNKIIRQLKIENFKVYYNKNVYKNLNYRRTSGDDFLVDLFCMSKSKFIFSTIGGGVPFYSSPFEWKKIKLLIGLMSIINFF